MGKKKSKKQFTKLNPYGRTQVEQAAYEKSRAIQTIAWIRALPKAEQRGSTDEDWQQLLINMETFLITHKPDGRS